MFFKERFPYIYTDSCTVARSRAITLLCLICFGTGSRLFAQQDTSGKSTPKTDTSDKITITIANSENFISTHTDSGEYNKFINNVVLYQGTDTLKCDSLYQNSATKNFEAFGDVKVAQQGGTHGSSDYLRYTTNQKLAFMRGNVSLTDGKNTLICSDLTYNLGTKVAIYDNWGQLHNDSTTVTSKSGVYNSAAKNARFTTHVIVQDPQYDIRSEDLEYSTETKVTEFYSKSVVTRDKGRSILETKDGTYDGMHGIAHFISHSSIWNDGQYIEGDSLYYNKVTGYGLAIGNVISIDTAQHSVLYCGRSEYFTKRKVLWATIKPVMLQVNGKDSFYMRADTFYMAPMKRIKRNGKLNSTTVDTVEARLLQDSVSSPILKDTNSGLITAIDTTKKIVVQTVHDTVARPAAHKGKPKNEVKTGPKTGKPPKLKNNDNANAERGRQLFVIPDRVTSDTAATDTTAPLYFIGYHHVLLFSDSLQAKCDSISYTRSDSTVRLMYNPIAWAHNSQITGDTILLRLDSTKLKSMYVPKNAFVVSQSGPANAKLFDQVQGKTLTAYFKNNTINNMIVFPEAQAIYYSKDEKGYYMGVVQATGDTMHVFFLDQKLKKIILKPDVHQTLTPMEQADLPGMKLSRFKWLTDLRPKSKEELFK